jgi:hypothetical protein
MKAAFVCPPKIGPCHFPVEKNRLGGVSEFDSFFLELVEEAHFFPGNHGQHRFSFLIAW